MWVWTKDGSGSYSVKSSYESIFEFELEDNCDAFQWLWKAWAPSNVRAFGWRVFLNRIQTKLNLAHRNIQLQNLDCPWCGAVEESTNHLLFYCAFAWEVWSLILNWLSILLVFPDDPKDHFSLFTGCWSLSKRNGLTSIWLAVVWHLWVGRNNTIFRGEAVNVMQIFDAARAKAWMWLRARNKSFTHSISEWHNYPFLCLEDM